MNKLFEHMPHPHQPRNVNETHREELASAGLNQRLAVTITRFTGTMTCAYAFALLALLGFPALSVYLSPVVAVYVVWFSQTFLQLIFLPVLSVGQSVLNRKAELQADEAYHATMSTLQDTEQIMAHQREQDACLLRIEQTVRDIDVKLMLLKDAEIKLMQMLHGSVEKK